MTVYGYARVSSDGQDVAGQVEALQAAGAERIYSESKSGRAGARRPQLRKLVDQLQPGDLLLVTRLSRLARSARDGLNMLAKVSDKGAHFRSLGEAWADTTTPAGRLMVTQLLGWAEFDREMILENTSAGRRRAKKAGGRFGRKPKLTGPQLRHVQAGAGSIAQQAALLGVSPSTISRARRALAKAAQLAPTPLEAAIADQGEP